MTLTNPFDLTGRTAVVVGSGSGLGRASAGTGGQRSRGRRRRPDPPSCPAHRGVASVRARSSDGNR